MNLEDGVTSSALLAAVVSGGNIWTSSNRGLTWTMKIPSKGCDKKLARCHQRRHMEDVVYNIWSPANIF